VFSYPSLYNKFEMFASLLTHYLYINHKDLLKLLNESIIINNMDKQCSKCLITKPTTNFYAQKGCLHGKSSWCKDCSRVYDKEKNKSSEYKLHKKNYELQKLYGITIKDYNSMLEQQNNKCKLCENSFQQNKKIHVDHCHNTGKIRGLLCVSCNRGLGYLKDDKDLLLKAVKYLKRESYKPGSVT